MCAINTFTDVSFIMVLYEENASWAAGEFFAENTASG